MVGTTGGAWMARRRKEHRLRSALRLARRVLRPRRCHGRLVLVLVAILAVTDEKGQGACTAVMPPPSLVAACDTVCWVSNLGMRPEVLLTCEHFSRFWKPPPVERRPGVFPGGGVATGDCIYANAITRTEAG